MKRVLLVVAIAAMVWLWWSGIFAEMGNTEEIRDLVQDAGAAGPVLFMALIVVLFPVFLAGVPIWISASLFPVVEASIYSWIGGGVAGVVVFLFARHWARDWAQSRIPERVRRWEERLEQRPLLTVIALRAFLWINPAADMFLSLSRVSTRDYVLGTAIGIVPATLFHVILGLQGMEYIDHVPNWFWIGLVATIAAVFTIRALRRRAAPPSSPPES
ncbi:MAG: VTT domain-containing protein [Deltaproteobacteria bacterium]